jgi:hypothetical protein
MTDPQGTTDCDYLPIQEEEDSSNKKLQPKNDDAVDMPLVGAFKTHAMIIGVLVGFFVQFSTLGANFLVIAMWENNLHARSNTEIIIPRTKLEIIILSLLWSTFTSFLAIMTLGFLRSVITIVFQATIAPQRRGPAADAMLDEVILQLEYRYVVGALVGVCLAWTVTDFILGMSIEILFSFITLIISLLWCKLMMHCFSKDEKQQTLPLYDEDWDAKEEEQATCLLIV